MQYRKSDEPRWPRVGTRVPGETLNALREIAVSRGYGHSVSSLVREAVLDFVAAKADSAGGEACQTQN